MTFSKDTFLEEVREAVIQMQNNFCRVKGCVNPIHSVHHKLSNSAPNRVRFKLFIQSILNAIGLCEHHHTKHSHLYRITLQEAEAYECFLEGLYNA